MTENEYWTLANDASHAAVALDNIRLKRCDNTKPLLVISALLRDNIPSDAKGADHPHLDLGLLIDIEGGLKIKSLSVTLSIERALDLARRLERAAEEKVYDPDLLHFLLYLSKTAGVKSHVGWRRRC